MIFSTNNREVEISKANDDSYFRKSDVVKWIKSNDCFGWLAEVETKAVIEDLDNLPSYSTKSNDNSADLISRKAVLDIIEDVMPIYSDNYHYILEEKINELPTIPQPKTDGDLISRKAVFDKLEEWDWQELYLPIHFKELVEELPTIPQTEEYCDTCKEYDTENHYCHRFSRVIKDTLDDKVDSVLEDIKAEILDETVERVIEIDKVISIVNKHISRKE